MAELNTRHDITDLNTSQEQNERAELAVRSALSLLSVVVTVASKEVDLSELLAMLVADIRYGTKDALARAIGISPSRLGRVMKGEGSLDVINCLRLAKVSGLPVDRILHAAGKTEIAVLIRELYGPAPARPPEADFLARLSDEGRQALKVLSRELGPEPKRKKH